MVRHDDPDPLRFNFAYRCHNAIFYYRCGHISSDDIRHRMCWRCRQLGWLCEPQRIEISRSNLDCRACQRVHGEAAAIARRMRRAQVENQGQGWNMEREMEQRREDMERRRQVAEERDREAEELDRGADAAADSAEGRVMQDSRQ